MRARLVVVMLAAMLALPALADASEPHAPPSSAEVQRAQAMMQFTATPLFRDQRGKPITSEQFTAAVKKGQHFVSKPDYKRKRFVLTLLPAGVDIPGSFSSANLNSKSSDTMTLTKDGKHYRMVFHDVHGKPIDRSTFVAGAAQHQRYTTHLDNKRGTAILTLLPLGVNKPGSLPTSLWATAPNMLTPAPKPGTHFPAFELPQVGGGRIDSAGLNGKSYVIDFFFADCVGCIAELPALNAYHKQYPNQPVFAITFDDAGTATAFVKHRHFNWPVAYDGKAYTDQLGIKAYPTMVVVGADGKVLATRLGAMSGTTAASLHQWVAASLTHAAGR